MIIKKNILKSYLEEVLMVAGVDASYASTDSAYGADAAATDGVQPFGSTLCWAGAAA